MRKVRIAKKMTIRKVFWESGDQPQKLQKMKFAVSGMEQYTLLKTVLIE